MSIIETVGSSINVPYEMFFLELTDNLLEIHVENIDSIQNNPAKCKTVFGYMDSIKAFDFKYILKLLL